VRHLPRVLLLALLAIMLPVRGVMAAAMLCAPTAADAAGVAVHAHAGGHGGAGHAPQDGAHHHDAASGPEACNLCTACCSVPPLAASPVALPLPQPLPATVFPAWSAPAPQFVSDGPERPPRST
jgi:hypothetical protein